MQPAPQHAFAPPPRASSLSEALAKRRTKQPANLPSLPDRTTSFADRSKDKGKGKAADDDREVVRDGRERDADLAVEHELKIGPGEFGLDPEGEEEWRSLEPNSGIRLSWVTDVLRPVLPADPVLSKRVLPHDQVQDHLYGRYFLKPPQLYSLARLSRDGATYDIPVDGDFVTIAVVAERGDIRVSGSREAASDDDDEEEEDDEGDGPPKAKTKAFGKGKGKGKHENKKKRPPRKYINLKLVALPPRNKSLGAASVGGDAYLQLLLFESDAIVRKDDGQGGVVREYRGGSGGAYEKWCNLAVGSVVALLNPRVLRPLKTGGGAPHPLTLPLALNPTSADSVSLIGHAMDLGVCTAIQKDGKRCRSWVDMRLGTVCEYHVHAAVKRGRATRAEFASATTSYELTAGRTGGTGRPAGSSGGGAPGDYDSYNPRLKRGLLPSNGGRAAPRGSENGGGGATYVVGRGVARTGDAPAGHGAPGHSHLAERVGRSQAQKRKRQQELADGDAALQRLFDRSGDNGSVGAKYLFALGKVRPKERDEKKQRPPSAFTAAMIESIGFDPSGRRNEDPDKRVSTSAVGPKVGQGIDTGVLQLASIKALSEASGRPLKLGRPAGPKRYSNVVVPPAPVRAPAPSAEEVEEDDDDRMVDLD